MHTSSTDTHRDRRAAIDALRARGLDNPESFLTSTAPDVIVRTCEWSDRQKNGGPGLIVWKLRQGGVKEEDQPKPKGMLLRQILDDYVGRHPEGSRLCSHRSLANRRWPDEECDCTGSLYVELAVYPVLQMVCDRCGFEAGLPVRAMRGAHA